jgi:glycosyltransferase involved in cell wall biosynthesis
MKVLYLFNKVIASTVEDVKVGKGHDSWLFGMLRLKEFGIDADFLELEKFIPQGFARFLRKHLLTMHYAHIPLLPLFFKYDVVFTSTAYGSLVLKALFSIKSFKWIILDFNLLGTLQECTTLKQRVFDWAIRKGADGIVAISHAEADVLKLRFPHLKDRIIFLHEATDTKFFKPQNVVEKKQIISVGNYARDFETLIQATKGLNVDVLIVGKYPEDKLKTLPSYVKVVQLNHNEVVQAYSESMIVVISLKTKDAYFDSVGTLSLGEAMSMGKPTIVTHTKSMESYIRDGVDGVFVKRENVAEMRGVLVDLLQNDDKRRTLGGNARLFAVQKLDSSRFTEQLALFLKSVI